MINIKGKLNFFGWVIMFSIFSIIYNCAESSVEFRDTDRYYYDINCVLVEKNKCGKTKTMLIRLEDKEFMHRELNSDNGHLLSDEMYYTYDVGDIMHFKFLAKDKFFAIDPDKDNF